MLIKRIAAPLTKEKYMKSIAFALFIISILSASSHAFWTNSVIISKYDMEIADDGKVYFRVYATSPINGWLGFLVDTQQKQMLVDQLVGFTKNTQKVNINYSTRDYLTYCVFGTCWTTQILKMSSIETP
jgi:hypothetical protein